MNMLSKKYLDLIFIILIIFLTYIVWCFKANKQEEQEALPEKEIIVLAYHHFLPSEDKEHFFKDNYNVMATEQFEEQMKYLSDNGYNSISGETLECFIDKTCDIPEKAFIITIDDGNISSYYEILPIIEKYNFYTINFVISGRIKEKVTTLKDSDLTMFSFLSRELLDDIHENHPLMTIGSHSNSLHARDESTKQYYYALKSYDELLTDCKQSYEALYHAKYYAYPFGATNEYYKKAVEKAGFVLAFSFGNNKPLTADSNRYELPRYNITANLSIDDFSTLIENRLDSQTDGKAK